MFDKVSKQLGNELRIEFLVLVRLAFDRLCSVRFYYVKTSNIKCIIRGAN